jgi:putative transposase
MSGGPGHTYYQRRRAKGDTSEELRHSGLGLHTPADVHYGTAEAVRDKRATVLDHAYRAHPERFVRNPPEPPKPPIHSWINPPNPPEEPAQ